MKGMTAIVAAATALVVIGTLEARESARQLDDVAGRVRLEPSGAGLTAIGLAASVAVYLALGGWSGADRAAFRLGAVTGALSGRFAWRCRWRVGLPARSRACGWRK